MRYETRGAAENFTSHKKRIRVTRIRYKTSGTATKCQINMNLTRCFVVLKAMPRVKACI